MKIENAVGFRVIKNPDAGKLTSDPDCDYLRVYLDGRQIPSSHSEWMLYQQAKQKNRIQIFSYLLLLLLGASLIGNVIMDMRSKLMERAFDKVIVDRDSLMQFIESRIPPAKR